MEWISVKDRLPTQEEFDYFDLFITDGSRVYYGGYDSDPNNVYPWSGVDAGGWKFHFQKDEITAWMIATPPKEDV